MGQEIVLQVTNGTHLHQYCSIKGSCSKIRRTTLIFEFSVLNYGTIKLEPQSVVSLDIHVKLNVTSLSLSLSLSNAFVTVRADQIKRHFEGILFLIIFYDIFFFKSNCFGEEGFFNMWT